MLSMGIRNGFNANSAMTNGMARGYNPSMMAMRGGYNPSFAMANGMYGGSGMQGFGNPYAQGYAYNGFGNGYGMGPMSGTNNGYVPPTEFGGFGNNQNGRNSSVLSASLSNDQAPRAKSKYKKSKPKVKRIKKRSS
jgi:hypothetical protein